MTNSTLKGIAVIAAILAGVAVGYFGGMALWNSAVDYFNPNWDDFWHKVGMIVVAIIIIKIFIWVTVLLSLIFAYLTAAITN